jgi:hypothetical protein
VVQMTRALYERLRVRRGDQSVRCCGNARIIDPGTHNRSWHTTQTELSSPQFNSAPNSTYLATTKHAFHYLNGSSTLRITYGGDELVMKVYCNADHGASEDRKSISGIAHTLAGGAVSYQSKKQSTIAISSTEAEYIALLQAVKESIWINRLLDELGRSARNGRLIYEDNRGAIALAHNPKYHTRTKHIDIQYYFIRECVENGTIELEYCPTREMIADALTKPLVKDRHWQLISMMGVETSEQFQSGSVGMLQPSDVA